MAWRHVATIQRQGRSLGYLSITLHTLKLIERAPPGITQMWLALRPLVAQGPVHSSCVPTSMQPTPLNLSERFELVTETAGALALSQALQSPYEVRGRLRVPFAPGSELRIPDPNPNPIPNPTLTLTLSRTLTLTLTLTLSLILIGIAPNPNPNSNTSCVFLTLCGGTADGFCESCESLRRQLLLL